MTSDRKNSTLIQTLFEALDSESDSPSGCNSYKQLITRALPWAVAVLGLRPKYAMDYMLYSFTSGLKDKKEVQWLGEYP